MVDEALCERFDFPLWWIIVVAPIEEVDKQLIIRQEYHIGL
jgi:hypothetical protein